MKSLTLLEISATLDLQYTLGMITAEQELDLIHEFAQAIEGKYNPQKLSKEDIKDLIAEMNNDPRESALNDEIRAAFGSARFDQE